MDAIQAVSALMEYYNFGSASNFMRLLNENGLRLDHAAQQEFRKKVEEHIFGRGSAYNDTLGKRIGPVPTRYAYGTSILKQIRGKDGINPIYYEQPTSANDLQAEQIEKIVESMDNLLGTSDKSNYFRLREVALLSKWGTLIDSIKKLTAQLTPRQLKIGWKRTQLAEFKCVVPPLTTLYKNQLNIWDNYVFARPILPDGVTGFAGFTTSVYLSSDKNIDLGLENKAIDFWIYFVLEGHLQNDKYQEAIKTFKKTPGIYLFGLTTPPFNQTGSITMDEARNLQNDPKFIPNDNYPEGGICGVLMKLSTWKKNANKWKYEFKARTGVHDRIYKTIVPQIPFKGYNTNLDAEQIDAQTQLNLGDGLNSQFVVLTEPTMFFGCHTDHAFQLFNMPTNTISINISYYTEANHFLRLLIRQHNLNRAYYGRKMSLQENSKNRLSRYLNRDKKIVKKLTNFLGADAAQFKRY